MSNPRGNDTRLQAWVSGSRGGYVLANYCGTETWQLMSVLVAFYLWRIAVPQQEHHSGLREEVIHATSFG